MINLTPIDKRVQRRLFEKMRALGKEVVYPEDSKGVLTQSDMMTRTTFIKMVSGQKSPVILMGGELMNDTTMNFDGDIVNTFRNANGYQDIYGPRFFDDVNNPLSEFDDDGELDVPGFTENQLQRPIQVLNQ